MMMDVAQPGRGDGYWPAWERERSEGRGGVRLVGLPSGRVTFAFTDVVGSTRALAAHGDAYVRALSQLQAIVAAECVASGGSVVSTEGDGAFLAFPTAASAVAALRAVQAELESAAREWPVALRVRAGAHTGDAVPVGNDYITLAVHVAARVAGAARAGQVLVSQTVVDDLDPRDAGVLVGTYALKDVDEPVVLWRMCGDEAPPAATPAARTNVPEPRTSLVGRTGELDMLRGLVRTPGVVTLVGPGGLGKTRLASELALAEADEFAGGAWLVELAPLSEPVAVASAVSAVIGLRGDAAPTALAGEISRRHDLLLVIDNCEHLCDAVADLVQALLPACPELRVICTSREPLQLPGERVVRLSTLATSTQELTAGPAEELFIARARAAGALVGPADLPAVTQVCRQLDGLPLALELAAARVAAVPMASMAEALVEGTIALSRRGGEQRQRSLDDLVEWSLRLLEPAARDALLALSVFPARFSPTDAAMVLGGVVEADARAVPELASRSLLDLDGDRYRMLTTIRGVVRRELDARPALRSAAFDSLLEWARRGAETERDRRDPAATPDADITLAWQAALSWGLEQDRPGLGVLFRRITPWALWTSVSAELRRMAQVVVERPPARSAEELRLQIAAMAVLAGVLHSAPVPLERLRHLVDTARRVGADEDLRRALSLAANVLGRQGLRAEARTLHRELLALTEDHEDLTWRTSVHLDIGVLYHLDGDLDEATRWYRSGLQVCPEEDRRDRSALELNLGEVALDRGEFEEAAARLRDVLRHSRELPSVVALALALLAEAELGLGVTANALALAEQAERALLEGAANDASRQVPLERLRAAVRRARSGQPAEP